MLWNDPNWLLVLWVIPFLGWLMNRSLRRRRAAAAEFASVVAHSRLLPSERPGRRIAKGVLLLAGLSLLVIALARPRWGLVTQNVRSQGVDLVVLVDVSRSMLADDLVPSRLDHAKVAVRDLLQVLGGDRVGLIAFAGVATVAVPLTTDHGFVLSSLDDLSTESVPRGGSLIGDAIRRGIDLFGSRSNRDQVLVLITDGEDHESFPLEAARIAAERDVKIFTVGLGDPTAGSKIPLRDERGNLTYLEHEGKEVQTRMDEQLLLEIAQVTKGAYVPARTRAYDLGKIYEEHLAKLVEGEIASERRQQYADRFQIFLLAGFACLLLESWIVPWNKTN